MSTTTDIDTLAEQIAADIINGNLSLARHTLENHAGGPSSDTALLVVQVIYALSYEMGGDIGAALQRVKKLLNR